MTDDYFKAMATISRFANDGNQYSSRDAMIGMLQFYKNTENFDIIIELCFSVFARKKTSTTDLESIIKLII
jgi:hypothetical protein